MFEPTWAICISVYIYTRCCWALRAPRGRLPRTSRPRPSSDFLIQAFPRWFVDAVGRYAPPLAACPVPVRFRAARGPHLSHLLWAYKRVWGRKCARGRPAPRGTARPGFFFHPLFRFLHRVVSNFAFAASENPGGPSGASFGLPREPKWGPGGPIRAPGNLPWQPGGPHWAPRASKGCPGGSYGSLPDGSRTPKMKLSSRRERRFGKTTK